MNNIKIENGIVVGTTGNKFTSKNPIARYLLKRFYDVIIMMARSIPASTILEIGCGEGHVTQLLSDNTNAKILATDWSKHGFVRLISQFLEVSKLKIRYLGPYCSVARTSDISSCPH